MPEKLSQGPRANPDLSRSSSVLGRGPTRSNKLPASPLSGTWPAPGSSLDLDFANNRGFVRGVGQGGVMDAITFTRASSATFVGSDGLLQTAAVGQPRFDWANTTQLAQPNLFTFTEQFDNAAWSKVGGSVTMLGAEGLFIPDTNSGVHYISQSLDAGATRTFSVDVKAAGYTKVVLVENVNTAAQSQVVDLTTGGIFNPFPAANVTVTALSDGWYRLVWPSTFFSQSNSRWSIYPQPDTGVIFGQNAFNQVWTGNGVSGIRIRYPQIELGSVATAYQTVGAVRAYTNVLSATTTSNGLLVEEARTNRALWSRDAASSTGTNTIARSEELNSSPWLAIDATVVANSTTSPDSTLTAELIYPTTSGSDRTVYQLHNVTTSATSNITLSVYAKAAGLSWLFIEATSTFGWAAWFNVSTGVVGSRGASVISSAIASVGNGWYRCSMTFVGTQPFIKFLLSDNDGSRSVTASGTNGIHLWGAQVVPGSTLTDYQPTTTTALFGWSRSNVTIAKNQTGVDGATNAATLVTATAADAVLVQPIVLASGQRTSSIYLKRVTGTGAVQCTLDGSSWSTVDLSTTEWRRIILSGTLVNPSVGVRLLTSGDAVAFDYAQVEDGLIATSPILTTTATVTRAADVVDLLGANFVSWYNPKECTLSVESFNSYTYQAGVAYPALVNSVLSMGAAFTTPDGASSAWGLRTGTRGNFTIDSQIYFYSGSGTDETSNIFNIIPANRMVTKMSGSLLSGTSFSTAYFGLVSKAYDSSTQFGSRAALTATALRIGAAFLFPFNGTVKRIVYYPKCYNDDVVRDLAL